ncbi:hypothetical protein BKA65DRAFT_579293 [Rhexocercosporidium sp. MPI-PUGE-AT-0058]|nr:hypothetical protein BKA65DRAFT_579293 [Rhexocercosporidium sp. MPI-PUGE-AT-0058]
MPSVTFQEELRELRDGLSRASNLIDSTRRFGMPSSTVSSLQNSLSSNVRAIDNAFTRCRSECGSEFERGDTIASDAINICNREIRRVETNSHHLRPRDPIENDAGLYDGRQLESIYNGVERDVVAAFEGLARRLGGGTSSLGGGGGGRGLLSQLQNLSSFANLGLRESGDRLSDGEVTISRHDIAMIVQHLRDSWAQETVNGRTMYVNVYEPSMRRSDRPRTGFIQVENDRGLGLGGWRARGDGIDGLGRSVLGLGLGPRGAGFMWDR